MKSNRPKISIIVPVFNEERNLRNTIESLLNQTLKNIEIILINDGSTDTSGLICKEFADLDNRIILLNKQNEGVSASRNIGINLASGKFIAFVDAGDTVDKNMYDELYNYYTTTNSDIILSGLNIIYNNEIKTIPISDTNHLYTKSDKIELIGRMLSDNYNDKDKIMGSACRGIYSHSLLSEYDILFDLDLHYMEDLLFSITILSHSESIYLVNKSYYNYFVVDGSASRKYRSNLEKTHEEIYRKIDIFLKDNNLNKLLGTAMADRYLSLIIDELINCFKKENKKNIFLKYKEMKSIVNKFNESSINELIETKYFSKKRLILLKLLEFKQNYILFIYFFGLVNLSV